MDDTSITFIDLVALSKIGPDSTVERFGGTINSTFFDASSILAGLKLKGLVEFVTTMPGQSALKITEQGTGLIAIANQKATEQLDALDNSILGQLAKGKRGLSELNSSVNVTQRDLAMHLFKLTTQGFVSYDLANANMSLYLTEKGFNSASVMTQQSQVATTQAASTPNASDPTAQHTEVELELKLLEASMKREQKKRILILSASLIALLIIVILLLKGII
jgi:DNA-binding HxlR family transcriptional regulator